ncbi:MAG: polymorphic toxin type 46 domain-containing protein, partial [Bacteroidota bacterium]
LRVYDFGPRGWDPLTWRTNAQDILANKFPDQSPYSLFRNNPIRYTDPDGRAPIDPNCPSCPTDEDMASAVATEFLTVKHSAYNLFTRIFGYEATFVDSENGGYRTGFVETNDGYWATVGKTALDVVTIGTFGRGSGPTGGLFAKTGGWAINSTIRQAAKAWSGIMATRFKIADNFYRRSGFSNYEDHLAGINFQKPVSVQSLKKGTLVEQWVREGGEVGGYFAKPGTDPAKLGISTKGRIRKTFELTEDTKVLKSTTQDIGGHTGGETQFFNPQLKDVLKEIDN